MNRDPEGAVGFPRILLSQRESYEGSGYWRDNSGDPPNSALVIQHTESGTAWLKTKNGSYEVPAGYAMLFVHGEDSSYGARSSKYQLKFVSMAYTRSICDLFNNVRREFGSVVQMQNGGQAECLMGSLMEAFMAREDPLLQAEEIFRFLIAVYREQLNRHQGDDPVAYGRFLLESQYRSPRNMSEWAEVIGITREHFSREFQRRYGESPAVFLRRQRLHHAQVLMKTSPYSVERIASLSGFSNVQSLRRALRQG
ncbi:helix-turn-helix domain-containing protein [Verrucomicrobiaceae bacterium N1E253]|uniref:Helix-turn-helix domain-containing protein n=1 Tax=Oceaniferula marina TaxID=2748318 RepID=A0A851GJ75_9BACT|nr:helix-turn-helix domain-containing protein [Oceaniferula marina]NWK55921.1 helix-turn-helix domain-containing protein [Oceaniferula marina]